jgi:sterol desaturase/sphingolipid hydroxylase (fatty acid hydroxylase superfamily)
MLQATAVETAALSSPILEFSESLTQQRISDLAVVFFRRVGAWRKPANRCLSRHYAVIHARVYGTPRHHVIPARSVRPLTLPLGEAAESGRDERRESRYQESRMDFGALIVRLLPVFAALALATLIEAVVPLRIQSRRKNGRLTTNLTLLATTLSLGMLLNITLAIGAAYVARHGTGLLQLVGVGPATSFIAAFLALDGATYFVHRLMHQQPILWRIHLVHHIDTSVDATTGFRQHPLDGLLRFSFIAATAWILGAPPAAVALYRLLSTLNSAFEHANIRVPRALDRILVTLWVTPDMHKIHHSRERAETDSNYANLFSIFDRLFDTYTPNGRGPFIQYGIAGYDGSEQQSVAAAFLMPFRRGPPLRNSPSVAPEEPV